VKHRRIAGEDGGGAVPLMDIAIHDEDTVGHPRGLQGSSRDGRVVEHTETFPVIRKGVVGATGEVQRDPVAQCGAARCDRGTGGAPRALHQFGRLGEADLPHRGGGECARTHLVQVVRLMHAQQLRIRRGRGGVQGGERSRSHALTQARVLCHWEPVAWWQWKDVMVCVKGFHGEATRRLRSAGKPGLRDRARTPYSGRGTLGSAILH
jgi:hypothetical protein